MSFPTLKPVGFPKTIIQLTFSLNPELIEVDGKPQTKVKFPQRENIGKARFDWKLLFGIYTNVSVWKF